MQARQFLQTVLSDDGYYCGYGIKFGTPKRTDQRFFTSIDELVEYTGNLASAEWNAYFALSTFHDNKTRTQANAKFLKSFFVDLDQGETKSYKSQRDCVSALREFCQQNSFPRPLMVNSGRGIHAYWPLTEHVEQSVWTPVAERFKAFLAQKKLYGDPAVTADSARILRMPDTLSFKDNPPLPVMVVSPNAEAISFTEFAALLGNVQAPAAPTKQTYIPRQMDDVTQALSGSYTSEFKLILKKTIAGRGCAQIARVVKEQATLEEPMWRAGLSIAKFCVDGDKAIHKISMGHPEYDPQATYDKADLIKGPYTCATFESYSPGVCDKCPHKGNIKSPITLGRVVLEATEEDNVVSDVPEIAAFAPKQPYVIPTYPEPYFRGKAGGVFKRAKNKEGDPIQVAIYHNDFYVVRRLQDPDDGEAILFRLHLPQDGVREFTVPLVSLLSKDEFRRNVAPNGVAVIDMEGLMAYVTAWVNKLQANAKADQAQRQFGWANDSLEGFVVGDKEIKADRIEHNPPSSATARFFPAFQSRGSLDEWKKIMDFYNRPGMEMHQYVIGLGFGSPLMRFHVQNASLFHIYSSDPGLGKTTAMMAAASIWGNPEAIMSREGDTINSKFNRAEVYKNIFFPIDEMTNIAPKDASDFLYQTTGGQQRNRMSSRNNEERTRGMPWHLLICSTGNSSLLERVSLYKAVPKAEATRVLEYNAKAFNFDTKTETDDLGDLLYNNYGHACVPYMQYTMANMTKVMELCKSTQAKLDGIAGLMQPHRFWSAQSTCAISGLMIAKQLGLVQFSIQNVVKWWSEMIADAKARLNGMEGTVEETLTNYLSENYNNILRIKSTADARTGEVDPLVIPDATPRMTLVARYEYDLKKMYLLPKPLREWCGKHHVNYIAFLNKLKAGDTAATIRKMRISKGTRLNLPPADVIELNCAFMDNGLEQQFSTSGTTTAI